MFSFEIMQSGLAMVFQPYVIAVVILSGLYGLFIGAMPGLTATMAVALLVPITFYMDAVPAIASIITMSAMAIFAGDIPGLCYIFQVLRLRLHTVMIPTP